MPIVTAPRPATTFLQTLGNILRSPRVFFRAIDDETMGSSVGFALAVFLPAIVLQLLVAYLVLATDLGPRQLPKLDFIDRSTLARLLGMAMLGAVFFIAYLVAFYQAVSGIAAKTRPEISQTIRGTCFGFAPMILAIIPGVGFLVGLVWSLALHAIALREMHGTSWIRAGLAVTTPLVVILLRFVYA